MNRNSREALLRARWHITHPDRRLVMRCIYNFVRPSSYPYISGDGFRRLADHRYDETCKRLAGGRVRPGSIIFVSTERVKEFFDEVSPQIAGPHVIITHNSDLATDEPLVARCGEHVVRWFAQNNTHAHEKVEPIPIGLENLHHFQAGIPGQFNALRKRLRPRLNRILVGFSVDTNLPERQPAYESAAASPCADCLSGRLSQHRYLETLGAYRFVLSPPGNGLDTHRTWEAMYLQVVPIVKDSVAMRSLERLGVPLWIVSDWEELRGFRERDLESQYELMKSRFAAPALYMEYWRKRIVNYARAYRADGQ